MKVFILSAPTSKDTKTLFEIPQKVKTLSKNRRHAFTTPHNNRKITEKYHRLLEIKLNVS